MPEKPSYSRLVLRLAWANTWGVFKHKTFDAVSGVISLAIGCLIFDALYGWSAVKEQIATFIAFVFAPGGLFLLFVFLWHLFLASDQLVYHAIRNTVKPPLPAPSGQKQKAERDWMPWKLRSVYTVKQLAAILAKDDPEHMAISSTQSAYQDLIIENLRAKKLNAIPRIFKGKGGTEYEFPPSSETQIKKEEAIRWAESVSIDVSPIK